MNNQQENSRISLGEISQALQRGVDDADLARAAGLEGLQGIRAAKSIGMQREFMRLSEKLGDEHPRVLALADALTNNQNLIRHLAVEIDRVNTQVPIVSKDNWVVHGFVRNQDGKGVSALTLTLHDSQGIRARELGHACTVGRGYFKLECGNLLGKSARPLYLHIIDGQGRLLFRDDLPLMPIAGQVDYREIILADEVTGCVPPCESDPCKDGGPEFGSGKGTEAGNTTGNKNEDGGSTASKVVS